MIAAVFDGMVFLQAATNDQGPAFACLELAEKHQIILHVSPVILAEVRDVLTRPKIQSKFPHLTPGRIDVFLQKVDSHSVLTDAVIDPRVKRSQPGSFIRSLRRYDRGSGHSKTSRIFCRE